MSKMRPTAISLLLSFLLSTNLVLAIPSGTSNLINAANDFSALEALLEDKYIISYRTDIVSSSSISSFESEMGYTTEKGYRKIQLAGGSFRALTGKFSKEELETLRKNPLVQNIEPDQIMRKAVLPSNEIVIQKDATWGLTRISHLGTGPWQVYQYLSCNTTTYTYIVDTGIHIGHEDFEGRAEWGTNTIDKYDRDDDGHGTHVAGTVVSKTFGIAKKGRAIAVKVLGSNGGGSVSSVMAGITWAFNDATAKGRLGVSSINASLGGSYSKNLNDLFTKVHNGGLYISVAAGNSGEDASYSSPSSARNVTVVAATDINDERPYFSNFGPRIDIFAPGMRIRSLLNSDSGSRELSGTSMASPHIAGLVAYYQCAYGARSNKEINERLWKCAAKGFVKNGLSPKDKENVATNCFPNSGATSNPFKGV